jgi:hypothetical protein
MFKNWPRAVSLLELYLKEALRPPRPAGDYANLTRAVAAAQVWLAIRSWGDLSMAPEAQAAAVAAQARQLMCDIAPLREVARVID